MKGIGTEERHEFARGGEWQGGRTLGFGIGLKSENTGQLPGHGRRGIDKPHSRPRQLLENRRKKRKMGAPKNDMVYTRFTHRSKVRLQCGAERRTVQFAALNVRNEIAGIPRHQPHASGKTQRGVAKMTAMKCAGRGKDTDSSRARLRNRRLDRRLHAHKGNVRTGFSQIINGRRRGRIAGEHYGLAFLRNQTADPFHDPSTHFRRWTRTVRTMGAIG